MNMRNIFKHVVFLLLVALCPAVMGQERGHKNNDGPRFPNKGVRFVICSAGGEKLPSPLYARVGDDYLPFHITSRMPSPRLLPFTQPGGGASIKLYERPIDLKQEKKTTPYLEIDVPTAYRNKSICVVIPNKSGKPKTLFVKENDFQKGGAYVVNLSQAPLEIITSTTGKFEGEEKRARIAPGSPKAIAINKDDANVWSYVTKKERQRVSFALNAIAAAPKTEPIRIRSSVFMPSQKVTQMSFVVEHPKIEGAYLLMSMQYADIDPELLNVKITPPDIPSGGM